MEDHTHPRRGYSKQLKDVINGLGHERNKALRNRAHRRRGTGLAVQRKTLTDALKQHGMKLCDGTKFNAVGKGILLIGNLPPSLSMNITALYLSQNDLQTLDGVKQFVSLRLLSVGGNLLASFTELEHLLALVHLRSLNLSGNPICDHPNYRLRVVDQLRQLQVLDGTDISKKEHELASLVASKDKALRKMVVKNHFDIQKLQRIVQMSKLHKDFYGRVFSDFYTGRFDVLPSPENIPLDGSMLLRRWKYEDLLSINEREELEYQIIKIVIRTHRKLADHPKLKAKEYLLKLANAPSDKNRLLGNKNIPIDIRHQYVSWEEAYGNVCTLQQQTIINLQGLYERSQKQTVSFLKDLLITDPSTRKQLIRKHCRSRFGHPDGETKLDSIFEIIESESHKVKSAIDSIAPVSAQQKLPPQQEDPETVGERDSGLQLDKVDLSYGACQSHARPEVTKKPQSVGHQQTGQAKQRKIGSTSSHCLKPRGGEFANATLNEAIKNFKLRDSPKCRDFPRKQVAYPSHNPFKTQVAYVVNHQNPSFYGDILNPDAAMTPNHRRLDSINQESDTNQALDNGYANRSRPQSQVQLVQDVTDDYVDGSSLSGLTDESSIAWLSSRMRDRLSCHVNPSDRRTDFEASANSSKTERINQLPSRSPLADGEIGQSTIRPTPSRQEGYEEELDQREEKYIRALMQSEQRELELRKRLNEIQRELAYFRQTMAKERLEHEKIKEEMEARIATAAAPKILKRFFIKWICFYRCSVQLKHIRKRRCFIIQHDWFWTWRRNIWRQQRLYIVKQENELRRLRQHFAEWVNVTRLAIIANHAQEVRERELVKHIFREWKIMVNFMQITQKFQMDRCRQSRERCMRLHFRQWRQVTWYHKQLQQAERFRRKTMQHTVKQTTFWKWKIYVLEYARPVLMKAEAFVQQLHLKQRRRYFVAWCRLIKVKKLCNFHLRQRIWRVWVTIWRAEKSQKEYNLRTRRFIIKTFFSAWHETSLDRIASRRSLSLAKRYVNQRRLRKLWTYWKFYSTAKKKYIQGSTKGLKHYFIKLLRSSWKIWRDQTKRNLLKMKQQKHVDLRRHFEAFRTGICVAMADKFKVRLLRYFKRKREQILLRECVENWQTQAAKNKRTRQYSRVIGHQTDFRLIRVSWNRWRKWRLNKLYQEITSHRERYDTLVHEKHEIDADLMIVQDKSVSLHKEVSFCKQQMKEQKSQLVAYQEKLLQTEEQCISLEETLKATVIAFERDRQNWAAAVNEEEHRREEEDMKKHALDEENRNLQHKVLELETQLKFEKDERHGIEKNCDVLRDEMHHVKEIHQSELKCHHEKQHQLEQEVANLQHHLFEEQKEREDTANRLQEYEMRIASTYNDIRQQEEEHEQDKIRLQQENKQIEAKWKEERARNIELLQLVEEKNKVIMQLSQKLANTAILSPLLTSCNDAEFRSQNTPNDETVPASSISCCTGPPPLGSLLNDMNSAITPQSNDMVHPDKHPVNWTNRGGQSDHHEDERQGTHRNSLRIASSRLQTAQIARATEKMIDEHTDKIHEDIRLLQERISKRLNQAPVVLDTNIATQSQWNRHRSGCSRSHTSISSSCTSLSDGAEQSPELDVASSHTHRSRHPTEVANLDIRSRYYGFGADRSLRNRNDQASHHLSKQNVTPLQHLSPDPANRENNAKNGNRLTSTASNGMSNTRMKVSKTSKIAKNMNKKASIHYQQIGHFSSEGVRSKLKKPKRNR